MSASATFKPRHLLTGEEFSPTEVAALLELAEILKRRDWSPVEIGRVPLAGKHLAMLFDKPSLRTRFSFAVAMHELGGQVVESVGDTRKKEDPEDTARVLSGYCHGIMVRTHADEDLTRMAKVSTIPIINALTDNHHPCQALADLLTIREKFGKLEGIKLAYVGDGNNVLHSLMLLAPSLGVELNFCCPFGRNPEGVISKRAIDRMEKSISDRGKILSHITPQEAVKDAHAVYTDTWVSMGFEGRAFADHDFVGFQVNEELMALARPDAIFLHCMPMVRGKEVSKTLPDAPCSAIFQQSENRLHVQKAVLLTLISPDALRPSMRILTEFHS